MADKEVSEKDKAFIELARKRFKLAEDADRKQRQRELEDLRFYAGDQWPTDILDARKGQDASGGMPAVPARPSIVINLTRGPVRQVLNEERQSDLGVEIVDADDFGDLGQPVSDEELELREGLVRRIQRHSDAAEARTWAFSRAAISGRGYYRVNTRYLKGQSGDQEITVERIFNQASVSLDPAHEKPDGSDAAWEFIGGDLTWDQYTAEYGTVGEKPNDVLSADSADAFRALGDEAPGWFKTEGETRMVRVVEYLHTASDGTIKWAKIDGRQTLDETDWPCAFMPVVKVLGEELHPYDGERRSEGIVRPAIGANRGFDFMVSRQVEAVATSPLPPFMVAEGQIETYEKWYEQANTRSLPYLPYRQRDLEGNPAGMPQRTNAESQIAAIANSVAMFAQAVQSTTMVHGTSLGDADPSVRSGKAAAALVQQQRQGTSNFMDNLVRSMHYEAMIINALLPVIYGREGRLTRIVTGDGAKKPVMLHKPMRMGGTATRPMPMPADPTDPTAKTYTLTKDATFKFAIKVTKNYDTRRQEEAAIVGEMISQNPQLMGVFGDLYFKNLDGPGHQEMAARAKAALIPQIAAMADGKTPLPPQVQQQLDQAGKMIQELTAHVNELTQQIQTKQVETQADLQKAQLDNATKLEIAKITAGAQITIADLKSTMDQAIATTKVELDQMRTIIDAAHEERLQMHQQAHDASLTAMEHAHDHSVIAHEAAVAPEPAPAGKA